MKRVDCPHCGTQLDPAIARTQSHVQCPQCGKQLRLVRKRDLRAAAGESAPVPGNPGVARPADTPPVSAPLATPEELQSRATSRRPDSLLPPPVRVPVPGRAPDAADESTIEFAPSIALENRPTRSTDNLLEEIARRKARTRLWMSAGLVAFTAVSIGTIFLLLNTSPPSPTEQASEGTEVDSQAGGVVKANAEKLSEIASDVIAPTEQPQPGELSAESASEGPAEAVEPAPPPVTPLAWGELKSFGRRDLEKLWAELHPYVFRLVVKMPRSERTVSGLLVDSRGYVVTSLSAIEGATAIEATPASSDPLGELSAEALKDDVRGVVAVDRARDLVLLQINRRLVNVVSGLKPTEKLLVPGRWLIQAAAVGPERFGWLTETRVSQSSRDEIPATLQPLIAQRELDFGTYWPQHQLQLSSGAGAGLFTDDGRLAAVNTGVKHEGGQLVAEAKFVFDLVKQAKEPAGPLSSLMKQATLADANQPATSGANDDSAAAARDGASPFSAGHEAEPLAKRLADAAFASEAFGWLPGEDGAQPSELHQALIAWREARELIRARSLFPEDSKLLARQVGYWTNRINATLLALDREQSAELNRKAWASLKGEAAQTLLLFVRVALQPGTSPRLAGAETATLQLVGTDQYLIAEVEPDAAPLLPDSEWLVVVTVDPTEEVLVSPQSDKQANARRARACKEIAEVKTIGFRMDPPKPDSEGQTEEDKEQSER